MNKRDIVIGLGVLAVVAGVVYFWQRPDEQVELPVPDTLSVEDILQDRFDIQIPEDAERAELTDRTDGDASAIAIRSFEQGMFEFTILADLPDPETGSYTVRVTRDDDVLGLGTLSLAKGGYMLNYQSQSDLTQYNLVQVLLGSEVVLEGSF